MTGVQTCALPISYEEAFVEVQDLVSFHTFIVCDHALRYSPGWNNDKLLFLVKK